MLNSELPVGTVLDTSDPQFTEEELLLAFKGADRSVPRLIVGLYRRRNLTIQSFTGADPKIKDRVRALARATLDRYGGIYHLVSPAGNISRRSYRGLEEAERGAWFSGGLSRILLVAAGSRETPAETAARLLRLFPENEALVGGLLRRLLKRGHPHLNTSADRERAIQLGRELLAKQAAD